MDPAGLFYFFCKTLNTARVGSAGLDAWISSQQLCRWPMVTAVLSSAHFSLSSRLRKCRRSLLISHLLHIFTEFGDHWFLKRLFWQIQLCRFAPSVLGMQRILCSFKVFCRACFPVVSGLSVFGGDFCSSINCQRRGICPFTTAPRWSSFLYFDTKCFHVSFSV